MKTLVRMRWCDLQVSSCNYSVFFEALEILIIGIHALALGCSVESLFGWGRWSPSSALVRHAEGRTQRLSGCLLEEAPGGTGLSKPTWKRGSEEERNRLRGREVVPPVGKKEEERIVWNLWLRLKKRRHLIESQISSKVVDCWTDFIAFLLIRSFYCMIKQNGNIIVWYKKHY